MTAPQKQSWWHEAIIDDMLANPLDTLEVRGKRLGYSGSYLSVLVNTDMFKAAYEERRRDFRTNMDVAIVNRTTQLAAKGLDIMLEVLESKRTQIPFAALSETVDKTLQRLGYGAPQKPAVSVQVTGNNAQVAVLPTVSAEQLAEARQALRAAEQERALEQPRSGGANPELKELADGILDLTPEPGDS